MGQSRTFPWKVPGVSVYRRGDRDDGRWIASWKECGKRRTRSLSDQDKLAYQQARAISDQLEKRKWGLFDPREEQLIEAARKPLDQHVDDYAKWLAATGTESAGHTVSYIRQVIRMCDFKTLSDIRAATVSVRVADEVIAKAGRDLENWSDPSKHRPRKPRHTGIRAANARLQAISQFTAWCSRDGEARIMVDPLAKLEKFPAGDPERPRRTITREQFDHFIRTTAAGPNRRGLSGEDRSWLWRFQAYLGLRRRECGKIQPEDVSELEVRLRVSVSKARREDRQPFPPGMFDAMRAWFNGKPRSAPIFRLQGNAHLALQADLEAAGIAYWTEDGVLDMHSLRHSFVTWLGEAPNANIADVAKLARHTDIRVTRRYMHPKLRDQEALLGSLPTLFDACPQEQRATGTDDVVSAPVTSTGKAQVFTPRQRPVSALHGLAASRMTIGKKGAGSRSNSVNSAQFTPPASPVLLIRSQEHAQEIATGQGAANQIVTSETAPVNQGGQGALSAPCQRASNPQNSEPPGSAASCVATPNAAVLPTAGGAALLPLHPAVDGREADPPRAQQEHEAEHGKPAAMDAGGEDSSHSPLTTSEDP